MATATVAKSKQTQTFTNAADIITVTGSDNKIYTKGGKDRITLVKGANNMIDAGKGADTIKPFPAEPGKLMQAAAKTTSLSTGRITWAITSSRQINNWTTGL